jgi:FixJ family two-component response regulator
MLMKICSGTLGLGAAAFLRKPINIDILLDHIQRELARRQ